MTDQEEFEKWFLSSFPETTMSMMEYELRKGYSEKAWQACAEQKNKIITAKSCENKRLQELIAALDYENKRQAKEIAAFRKALTEIVDGGYFEVYMMYGWGITDKYGNPTKLLTGEK